MKTLYTKKPSGGSTFIKASLGCAAALLLASTSILQAQVIMEDDFESYDFPDEFDLKLNWPNSVNNGVQASTEFNRIPGAGSQSVKISASNDRTVRALASPVQTGVTARYTVYIYNTNFVQNTRVLTGLTTSDSVNADLGIGWFNNATAVIDGTADAWQGSKYQGRVTGAGGNFYFNLNNPGTPDRRTGWQKFDIERLPSGVTRFYVDDILGRTVTNLVTVSTSDLANAVIGFGLGSIVDHIWFDGVSVGINHPEVTSQPQDAVAINGGTVQFSVTANNATSYQWRRYADGTTVTGPYIDLPGETNSTLVLNNVTVADATGWYSVVVSNANGAIGSRAAKFVIAAPYITAQPLDQVVVEGGTATLTATAAGEPPLSYQWKFESADIPGATQSSYVLPTASTSNAGAYSLFVSNSHGNTTSSNAILSVFAEPNPDVKEVLWRIPATASGFMRSSGSATRGLAVNPVSGRVIVVSRAEVSGGQAYVLDGDTGALLHTLDSGVGVVGGGTYFQTLAAVADDGVVFVCNLTLDATTDPFKIYRYETDDAAVEPVLAYEGDPGAGTPNRWGDNIAIRGSGSNTRILVGSRFGKQFAVIDPNTSAVTTINVTGVGDNEFGLGVAFGQGDTIWAKVNSKPLYHIGFDGTILHTYDSLPTVGPIAIDPVNNLLAANAIGSENPDNLRLYDISNLNNEPVLLDFEFYNTTDNTPAFGTGAINFGANGRIYALNENQGIIAWQTAAPGAPVLNLVRNGTNVELSWTGAFKLQSATVVDGPYSDVTPTSPHIEATASAPAKFFRLINNP